VTTRANLIGASRIRRRREGRERAAEPKEAPLPTVTTSSQHGQSPAKRRRQASAPQDHALYSCSCGFVFKAHVSTSVDCPHCGGTQAW
jgi:hypothetical protein